MRDKLLTIFQGHMSAGTEWKLNWSRAVQCVKVPCTLIGPISYMLAAINSEAAVAVCQ